MELVKEFLKEYKLKQPIEDYYKNMTQEEYDWIHNPNREEILIIGEFSHFKVTVHSHEKENIPHFHVVDLNTNEEVYISLIKPEYVSHNGKLDRVLTEDEIIALIEWLNAPDEDLPKISHFQGINICWNMNNFSKKISDDLKIPNYKKLI